MIDSHHRKLQPLLQPLETTEATSSALEKRIEQYHEKALENFSPKQELQPKVLSSLMVSLRVQECQKPSTQNRTEPQAKLMELLQSPSVQAILDAAGILAKNTGLTSEDALKQMLITLKEIDRTWEQILITEGVARLSSQTRH